MQLKRKHVQTLVVLAFILCYQCADATINKDASAALTPMHIAGSANNVELESEIVHMEVGAESAKVTSTLAFHNKGAAGDVCLGFMPEPTWVRYETGESIPVKEEFIWELGHCFKATLNIPAGGTVTVMAEYTIHPGVSRQIEPASNGDRYKMVGYCMENTCWPPLRKREEIDVTFLSDTGIAPTKLVLLNSPQQPTSIDWRHTPSSTIAYRGPCKPIIEHNSIRFQCTDFHSSFDKNVAIWYRADQH